MAANLYDCSKSDCTQKRRKDESEFRLLYLLSCAHSICESCLVEVVKNKESFVKCDICAFTTNIEGDVIKNINLQINGHSHESSFGAANTGVNKFSAHNSEVLPVDAYVFGQAFNAGSVEARKTVETIDIDLDNDIEMSSKVQSSTFEVDDNDPYILSAPDRIRNKARPEFVEVVEFGVKSYVEQRQSWRNIIEEKRKINYEKAKSEADLKKHFHLLHSILQIREMEATKEIKEVFELKSRKLNTLEEQLVNQRRQLKSLILKSAQVNVETERKKVEVELKKAASQPAVFSNKSDFKLDVSYDQDTRRMLRKFASVARDNSAISNSYTLLPIQSSLTVIENGGTIIEEVMEEEEEKAIEIDVDEVTDQLEHSEIEEPVKINRLNKEVVRVTNIINPEHFYVVLDRIDENSKTLQKEIDTWCCSSYRHPPSLESMQQGMYCFAYSDMFKNWCRARFENAVETSDKGSRKVRNIAIGGLWTPPGHKHVANVFLIDYGAIADVQFSNIREGRKELFDMTIYPQRCIRCSLYNVRPYPNDDWNQKSVQCLDDFVNGRDIVIYVKEVIDGIHYVDLSHYDVRDVSSGKSSFIEIIVFTGNAKFKLGDTYGEHPFTTKPHKTYPSHKIFEISQNTSVLPVHVENPDLFYVNLSSAQFQAVELFKKMQLFAEEESASSSTYRIFLPKRNLPCVAKFKDNMYYRGLITDVRPPEKVSVLFVDYGNEEERDISELRHIKDEFLRLEKQAIPCCLADVKPLHSHKWSDNAIRVFKDLIAGEVANGGQMLTMSVCGYDDHGKASVVLRRFDGVAVTMNINVELVKQEFAQSTGPFSITGDILHKVVCKSEDGLPPALMQFTNLSAYNVLKEMTERNEIARVPKKDRLIQVLVSHWKNPGTFWIQIATKELIHHLKTVEEYMSKEMTNPLSFHSQHAMVTADQPFNIGEMCLYKKVIENTVYWRRGKVIESFRDADERDPRVPCQNYRVMSFDYGDTVELKRKDLVHLSPTSPFLKNKSYCVRCRIFGIIPAGGATWTQTALEHFGNLLKKHQNNLHILVKQALSDEEPDCLDVSLIAKESIIPGPLEPRIDTFQPFKNLLERKGVAMPAKRRQRDLQESDDEVDLNCSNPVPIEIGECSRTPMPFSFSQESSLLSKLKKEQRMSEVQTIDTNARYLEPDFPDSQTFKAIITDVDSDFNIHFRVVTDDVQQPIQTVNEAILKAMRERETLTPFAGEFAAGRACSAYFEFDKTWNRAEITGIVRDERNNHPILQVRFVDYGNVDDVYPEQLSSDVFVLEIPKLALYGRLYGCKPFSNSVLPKLIMELRTLIDKTLIIQWENYLIDKLPMKISIQVPEHGSLRNILLNKDLIVEEVDTDDLPEEAMRAMFFIEKSDFVANNLSFSLNTFYPVAISHPVSLNYLFLQALEIENPTNNNDYLITSQSNIFVDMIQRMRSEASNFNHVGRQSEGSIVCAKFVDDEWYRCVVTSNSWSGRYTDVLYVDYGNSGKVTNQQIRELPSKFVTDCPTHAFLVRLGNIRPSRRQTWKPKHSVMIAEALSKLGDRNLVAMFTSLSFPFTIDLYEASRSSPRQPMRHALRDLVSSGEFEFINDPIC